MKKNRKTPAQGGHARLTSQHSTVYIKESSPDEEKEDQILDFFEKNYEYIFASATVKALDVAKKTDMPNDIEDFRQEVLIFLARRIKHYNPAKGAVKTFIEVCAESARKNLIRNIHRRKINIEKQDDMTIINSIPQPESIVPDLDDYINALPEPARTMCHQFFREDLPVRLIGRRFAITSDDVVSQIRQHMAAFAAEHGVTGKGTTGRTFTPPPPGK